MITQKNVGRKFFTVTGDDVFRVKEVETTPTAVLEDMERGEQVRVPLDGTELARRFHAIGMPAVKNAAGRKGGRPKKTSRTNSAGAGDTAAPALSTRKEGTSRYKGVSLHKASGKWRAQISRKGNYWHKDGFATEEEAAAAVAEHLGDHKQAMELRNKAAIKQAVGSAKDKSQGKWQCTSCAAGYEVKPEKCDKCGKSSFERI